MWSESSCAFPKNGTATGSRRERSSNGGQRRDKSVHISTTKVSFSTIIRLSVKRGTWNGMERGMEHGMERGTDVKCPSKSNKRVN